jgi:hypothetical protein
LIDWLGRVDERIDMEWQPIETAPKDMDLILTDGEHVSQGGWLTDIDYGAEWEGELQCAGWWSLANVTPTHWMPLPKPPAA